VSKSNDKTQPIIIKKKKGHHGAHGGAWKIAYADFVTAMMAFFLLMWLLGSTTKGELMGIAEYFQTPLQVALFGGSGAGDASSVIQGGGKDLTRSSGQVKRGDSTEQKKIVNIRAARAELDLPARIDAPQTLNSTSVSSGTAAEQAERAAAEKSDAQALQGLKAKIEEMIETLPGLAAFKKQLLLELTDEGLRIQIIDDQNRPMFDLSSSTLKPYAVEILDDIALALNDVPNKITISGHTDATPYKNDRSGMSNWELSADRANAARREMTRAGMADSKVIRVVGHASSSMFKPDAPTDPINRRISIVVLKRTFPYNEIALTIPGTASTEAKKESITTNKGKP
jgi:chemotaxis protein MotB